MHEATIFVPLSGRTKLWQGFSDLLLNLDIDKMTTQLCLLDTSGDPQFGETVRRWIDRQPYGSIEYGNIKFSDTKKLADQNRAVHFAEVNRVMVEIYKVAQKSATGEKILILEDDMRPTPDVYRRLTGSLKEDVFSVSAAYLVRDYKKWVLWRDLTRTLDGRKGHGVERVEATGFGCVVMRTADFQAIELTWEPRPVPDEKWPWGYDMEFFRKVRETGKQVLVDWTIKCDHLSS